MGAILNFSIDPNDPANQNGGFDYDTRAAMARQLIQNGTSYAPVQSPWQGAARLAQALSGNIQAGQLASDAAAKSQQYQQAVMGSLFGLQASAPATSASAPAATAPGMTPANSTPSAGQDAILSASNANIPNNPALAQARSPYAAELQDPNVATKLAAITHAEVGSQGPQAQQAFVESVLNRAAARGQTLNDTLSSNYFPQQTFDRAATFAQNPAIASQYAPIIGSALNGSNVSNFATGNASGTVGFAGGPQTYAANGERFGVEGPDQKWAGSLQAPQAATPGVAAINANMPQPGPANATPSPQNPRAAMMASMLQNGVPSNVPSGPSPQSLVAGLTGNSPSAPSAAPQTAIATLLRLSSDPSTPPQLRQMAAGSMQMLMQPKYDFITRPDNSVIAANKFNPTQSVQVAGPSKTNSIIEGPIDPNTGIAPKMIWNPIDGVSGILGPNGQVMPPGQFAGQGVQPQQPPQNPNMPGPVVSAPLPAIGSQPSASTPAPSPSAAPTPGTLGPSLMPPASSGPAANAPMAPTTPSPGIGGIPTPQGVNIPEYIKKRGELAANESMPSASDELGFSQKLMERPSYKEYSAAIPTWNSFTQHIQDNSPASDKAIVDDFAKILNPGRAVTTGAFQLNMDAQSVPAQLQAEIMKAFNGNGALGPDARAQMARAAEIKMNQYKSAWGLDAQQAQAVLQGHPGLKPERVIPQLPDQSPIDYSRINIGKTTAKGLPPQSVAATTGLPGGRFAPSGPTEGQQAQPPSISSAQDYNSLPSGTVFIAPTGEVRRKP